MRYTLYIVCLCIACVHVRLAVYEISMAVSREDRRIERLTEVASVRM